MTTDDEPRGERTDAATPPGRGIATELIAHAYVPPSPFGAVPAAPTHRASTIVFADCAALRARTWKEKTGYTYGLHGTPTTFALEARIATLEGGTDALLTPSGLAAIALVDLALCRSGDEVVLPDNAYGPSRELARHELAGWGVAHRFYDPMDPASLRAVLGEKTRLVWIEPPGSVTMEFPDLAATIGLVRAASSAEIALDDTWGAGLAFDAFRIGGDPALGADVVVQALTKYPSGGADVLMGSVVTRDPALHQRLKATHMRLGLGVAGDDAERVLRSLPSLPIRYAAQDAAGRALAAWWQGRPEVQAVLHPALPGSPGHANWKQVTDKAAGLFSVVFDARHPAASVDAFVDALRLFRIGYSWAGPVSLAVPYDLPVLRARPRWKGALVRFSVGLEEVADLIADGEQALARTLSG